MWRCDWNSKHSIVVTCDHLNSDCLLLYGSQKEEAAEEQEMDSVERVDPGGT